MSPTDPLTVHLDTLPLQSQRITSVAELQEVGFGELIQDDHGVKLVEWAEYAKTLLPPSGYDIHFYNDDADSNTRRIEVMQLLQLQSTKNHAMP